MWGQAWGQNFTPLINCRIFSRKLWQVLDIITHVTLLIFHFVEDPYTDISRRFHQLNNSFYVLNGVASKIQFKHFLYFILEFSFSISHNFWNVNGKLNELIKVRLCISIWYLYIYIIRIYKVYVKSWSGC